MAKSGGAEARKEQRGGRMVNVIEVDGDTRTYQEWADELGCTVEAIRARLRKGWDPRRAVTEPPDPAAAQRRRANVHRPPPKPKAPRRATRAARRGASEAAKADPVLEDLDRRFTEPTDEEIAEDLAPAPGGAPGPVRAYLKRRIAEAERELAAMRAALEAYDEARA